MSPKADQELDNLVAEITKNADTDAARMAAFHAAIDQHLKVPLLANSLGYRVHVERVDYESIRRGIVAVVRVDGRLRRVALLDVMIPGKSKGAKLVRAYQRWAGVETDPAKTTIAEATTDSTDPVEAVVLKVGINSARLRILGAHDEVTYKGDTIKLVPGHIATVKPKKRWTHRRYAYMSGAIEAAQIDIPALGLKPLGLKEFGMDDPDDGEPYADVLAELWQKVIAKPRMAYELEQVVPGADERDWEDDPITNAVDLRQGGDPDGAEAILMDLLHVDLRCIDAHAHLGNWAFDGSHRVWAETAVMHYEVGIGIVEQTLGHDFDGFLP